MSLRKAAVLLVCGTLLTGDLYAADKSQQLRDRLKDAAQLSALDGADIGPWHWKVDLSISDTDGKNTKSGTLEMWFGDGKMKSVWSLGNATITFLRIGDKLYQTGGDLIPLDKVGFIETQLLHPIPDEVFQSTVSEKLQQRKVAAEKIDCIAPTLVKEKDDSISTDPPFSFCMDADTPRLLMTVEPGSLRVIRMHLGKFQSHEVATDLEIFSGSNEIIDAKTVSLAGQPIDDSVFELQPDMVPVSAPVEVSSTGISWMCLSHNAPSYPVSAKQRHAEANLVFDAVIGKDGHILSLQQVGSADAELSDAAAKTIRSWIYRPYLLNGIPVEVKTQIHLNFSMG